MIIEQFGSNLAGPPIEGPMPHKLYRRLATPPLLLITLLAWSNCGSIGSSEETPTSGQLADVDTAEAILTSAAIQPAACDGLTAGTRLQAGQGVRSCDGQLQLMMQGDGNLVLYRGRDVLWSSRTAGRCSSACVAQLQGDGNLVLLKGNTPYWQSATSAFPGSKLVFSTTPPYLSIRSGGRVVWAASQGLRWFSMLDPFNSRVSYGTDRPGMPDFMTLFSSDSYWQGALSRINVVKLYQQTIMNGSDGDLRTIFAFLRQHNIALALEFGPVTPKYPTSVCPTIEGHGALPIAVADRIKRLGGDLRYAAMDEPFYYMTMHMAQDPASFPAQCTYSIAELAANVAQSVEVLKQAFPAVQVGDIEPLAAFTGNDWLSKFAQWTQAFRNATGVPLAFVHEDATPEDVERWQQRIGPYRSYVESQRLPLGLFRSGYSTATDSATNGGLLWNYRAQSRELITATFFPSPDHDIFQTWHTYPATILPETSPSTFAYSVHRFYASYRDVFRLRSAQTGEHMYSINFLDTGSGYEFEGLAFRLLRASAPGTTALYRCLDTRSGQAMHFTSRYASCEGAQQEGALGYLYTTAGSDRLPLFRSYNPGNGDHLLTSNSQEARAAGYVYEGVLGYVPR